MRGEAGDGWEERVRRMARAFPYPETPDIARHLGVERHSLRPQGMAAQRLRRRLAAGGLVVALLLAGLMAVPEVRAAVVRALRIGAIRIVEGGATATPGTPLAPAPALEGETTLAEARQQAGFAVRLPRYPADLGPPDRVYLQDLGGPVVVLVWVDEEEPEKVSLALHQLGPGTFGDKVQPPVVQATFVHGNPAVWTQGPYLLQLRGGNVDVTRLVTGNVLVWSEDEVTYRLENELDMEEAVRIAESLE